jgi:phosphonate transport system permease protein
MAGAVDRSSAAPAARPAPPPRSPWPLVSLVAFLGITVWVILGLAPNFERTLANLGQAAEIASEFWPPEFAYFDRTIEPIVETFQMAVIASVIGCGVALPVAFLASRVSTLNAAVYWIDRSVLSVVRSIPDILYALIFVAALSVGPLPGVLALILFSIGVVAKLLSETVEGVDPGPIVAATATGGSHLQVVASSILPQVLPNYVAYALYTFELNIRASAVIGFVGAGGIGLLLETQRRFFRYDRVALVVLELFVMVVLIEFVSERLRRRLT